MTLARLLRLAAFGIAVAGVVDPVLTRVLPVRQSLAIVVINAASLDLPDGDSTRRARALEIATSIQESLKADYAVSVQMHSPEDSASACPHGMSCVVISDGTRPSRLIGSDSFVGGVKIGSGLSPNVSIAKIESAEVQNVSAVGAITVALHASGATGQSSELQVYDGDVLIGSASHTWVASQSDTRVRIDWVPLKTAVRKLHIVVSSFAGERTLLDNEADIAIDVRDERAVVLVYEPRPTWTSTFVRRALQRDPRFVVGARTRPASSVVVDTGSSFASAPLDSTDAAVLIVGSPDALMEPEVAALERFARNRGGSVILLPDQRAEGPAARLLPPDADAQRLSAPAAIGALRATEVMTFREFDVGMTALAKLSERPIIASRPFGKGHIVTSGALDAWRHRDDAFDSYWQSLVANLAAVSRAPLDVSLSPRLLHVGDRAELDIAWNAAESLIAHVDVSATLTCGSRTEPVRLWPSGQPGRFRGNAIPQQEGDCRVDVALSTARALSTSAWLTVDNNARSPMVVGDELAHAVKAHGGILVDAGHEGELVEQLRARAKGHEERVDTRPLRLPWWIAPFALCLGGEWWLRRRRGLR